MFYAIRLLVLSFKIRPLTQHLDGKTASNAGFRQWRLQSESWVQFGR
jgi:hypothetical protein